MEDFALGLGVEGDGPPGTVGWNQSGGQELVTGSHRASRGGGRAAAREARRQQVRRRNQLIGAGAAVVLLVGGGGFVALNAFGGNDSPSNAKSGNPDDKPSGSDSGLLSDAKVLLDGTAAKQLAPAAGAWAVASTDN